MGTKLIFAIYPYQVHTLIPTVYFMCQYSVFYGEYENEKKTGQKKFDLPQREFEPRIFESWERLDQ